MREGLTREDTPQRYGPGHESRYSKLGHAPPSVVGTGWPAPPAALSQAGGVRVCLSVEPGVKRRGALLVLEARGTPDAVGWYLWIKAFSLPGGASGRKYWGSTGSAAPSWCGSPFFSPSPSAPHHAATGVCPGLGSGWAAFAELSRLTWWLWLEEKSDLSRGPVGWALGGVFVRS